jgi:hypothetical protein
MTLLTTLLTIAPDAREDDILRTVGKLKRFFKKEQVDLPLEPLCPKEICRECHTLSWDDIAVDPTTRDAVCTNCAVVINERVFEVVPPPTDTVYSSQRDFESKLIGKHKGLKLINTRVEEWLKDATGSTGEQYKNRQRDRMYELLAHWKDLAGFDISLMRKAQGLFHVLRTRMARVHRPRLVLIACLVIADQELIRTLSHNEQPAHGRRKSAPWAPETQKEKKIRFLETW